MRRYFGACMEDRWNILDTVGLATLVGGVMVRIVDSASMWGRVLYALSAPLMFSRILFFAQFFRFQSPMIRASYLNVPHVKS